MLALLYGVVLAANTESPDFLRVRLGSGFLSNKFRRRAGDAGNSAVA